MGIIEIIIIAAIFIVATIIKENNNAKKKKAIQQSAAQVDVDIISSIDLGTQQTISAVTHKSNTTHSSKKTTTPKKTQQATNPLTQTPKGPKTPANTPKTAPNTINEEEFDLRKAVIYSEILSPKFKDEDF